jgi:hypothetical protein
MDGRVVVGVLAVGLVGIARVSFAGRPLTIDDADPVDVRQFELEAEAACFDDSDCKHWDFPVGLTYGLVSGVEVGAGVGGQFEERTEVLEDGDTEECSESGIGDLVVGTKWHFLGESAWCPRQALVPAVKFPTADEDKDFGSGEMDYDLTWIASRTIREKAQVDVNVGYSWIGQSKDKDVSDLFHYGLALEYQLFDRLQCVGEVFAQEEIASSSEMAVQ